MRVSIRFQSCRHLLPRIFALLVAVAGLGAAACPARASDHARGGFAPPRLGFVDGS
jgi:hypothetical protein